MKKDYISLETNKMDKYLIPVISVILPVYNGEQYLRNAIDSILNQTFTNFEFIIINDGSTDNTEEIILSFKDQRIDYIKNDKNKGLIYSLNIGLGQAKGKYIARMDADDISMPGRLEKQINFLETNPEYGIVGGQMEMIGQSSGIFSYPIDDENIRMSFLSSSAFPHPAVMFRSAPVIKYGIRYDKQFIHAEDYKFWLDLLKYTKGYNLPISLINYRIHKNAISSSYNKLQRINRNGIRKLAFKQIIGIDKKTIDDFFGNNYRSKVNAYRAIVLDNRHSSGFNKESLKNKLKEILYKDALEKSNSVAIYYKFPLLFPVFKFKMCKLYSNLIKHRIKSLMNK